MAQSNPTTASGIWLSNPRIHFERSEGSLADVFKKMKLVKILDPLRHLEEELGDELVMRP